ncbi:hypothetical protein MUCCIDRAFT_80369 [Mucor lusitanicus CBS 277.49]|uniref:Uncharacterized protein n=2 Tax=Mucor circinelloides f. lusitanicus TaxID=29924 RepID=A0A168MRH2_MUCCL|nr:hypothetical protein MUCCIDRAFT_80369 [Mucor lusitanicus CBS 277.49]
MTHLSVWKGDRFRCLRFKSIISGELKSIITILLILMMLMQFMWDIVSTYVKYEEGFTVYEGKIITKPFAMWSSTHQTNMMAMDYVECVTFSLQVGVFFLMQSFWNYLSNTVAKKSFMGSFEFKFYILWALGSMAMFPILQWVFRNDVNKREGIPQLAYGIEALITSLLGVRSHFRFKRIIALSHRNNGASNKAIVTRLAYFKDMNVLISIILFFYAASFIVLCSDGLTDHKIINTNKFATDTIIANVNICTVFLWLLLISIFHPRPQYSRELGGTSLSNDDSYVSRNQTRPQASGPGGVNGRANNFVVNESTRGITENVNADGKYIGAAISTNNNTAGSNPNGGGFMRAMSPVTVDYPHSLSNDTMPLTSSAGTNRPLSPPDAYQQQQRNLAVEDPYSSQPVMFSMMDIKQQQQQARYGSPTSPTQMGRHDIPMRGMNSGSISRINTSSPQSGRRYGDDEIDYMEYEQTRSPHKIGRPSWERSNDMSELNMQSQYQQQQQQPGQPGEQMVRDWLWQSPDRRNT